MNTALLQAREVGGLHPQYQRTWYQNHRLRALDLLVDRQILHGQLPSTEFTHDSDEHALSVTMPRSSWVASLALERIDQRYLLCGSGNGSVQLYDLREEDVAADTETTVEKPVTPIGEIPRQLAHTYTVSDIHWYPFDTGLFTTTSYDQTLKVWDTNSLQCASTFALGHRIFSHAVSSIASHCLIAANTADSFVRLCDLKSGSFTHSLAGHRSQVICAAWSPRDEFLLCTGGADGTARLWDIRRAKSCLVSLDWHNYGTSDLLANTNVAHNASINGLAFTHDGHRLASLGADRKMRLWDVQSGRHLLVNYGSKLPCTARRKYDLVIPPLTDCWPPLVFIPFSKTCEVGCWDLYSGEFVKTLKGPFRPVICAAWRQGREELYAGGYDQEILAWAPEDRVAKTVAQIKAQEDNWSDSD
ncbi:hypothetical protein H4R34_003412, partial [Dimargaris verticillata]